MPSRRALATFVVGLAACALGAPEARASGPELFGPDAASIGRAAASSASATDGSAAFLAPAGLAFGRGFGARALASYAHFALRANGKDAGPDDAGAAGIAIDADVPFEGALEGVLRFGLLASSPPGEALRVVTHAGNEPFFPHYDGRASRLVVVPAIAARLAPSIAVGVAADVLAGVSGPADVAPGASRDLEAHLDEEVTTVAAPIASLRVDPSERLHLALTWRARFAIPTRVTTTATIGGVPLVAHVEESEGAFDPARVVVACAFEPSERVGLELDATYARFSTWSGPLMRVEATLPGVYLVSSDRGAAFRDTITIRGAGTYALPLGGERALVLRAGGGFEPSILRPDAAQGVTNYLDGHRAIIAAGVGFEATGWLDAKWRLDLGAQAHLLGASSTTKTACTLAPCAPTTVAGPDPAHPSVGITDPGYPTLSSAGSVWVGAVSLGASR